MTKRQKFFSALKQFFKNVFTKNIKFKVIALVFALLLWGYVLAIENPEYVKRVRDVEITITGEDSLNARGLMLVTRDTGTTDIDVLCRISKHSELDLSRVSAFVDLSDRTISLDRDEDSKTITLEVQTKVASDYGTVQGVSVGTVELTVARLSSRSNIRVNAKTEGELPEGFVYELPSNLTISIRGQKSEIDRISRGEVTVNLSSFAVNDPETLSGTYDLILPVQFYDSANKRLDDIVTSDGESVTTNVRVHIRACRVVDIEPTIEADEEFSALYACTCTPAQKSIVLYGDRAVLDRIDVIRTEPIFPQSVEGEERMLVDLIIPNGVEIDRTQLGSITVLLQVSERSDIQEFEIPISYTKIKDRIGLTDSAPMWVTVQVSGKARAMQSFDPSKITASVNLQNFGTGTYEIPIEIRFSGDADVYRIEPLQRSVKIELINVAAGQEGNE
jgi:YbbR domain-containing protein